MSYSVYGRLERDFKTRRFYPRSKVLPIKDHERCFLYRRRSGIDQEKVASDLQLCRWWLNRMERGLTGCDVLLWYWEC